MSKVLVGKWKLQPTLLRTLSQKASLTVPFKHQTRTHGQCSTFARGKEISVIEWASDLSSCCYCNPKCSADVSFYISKAFLSSIWADLTEPWSSFKDFSLSSLTVAPLRVGLVSQHSLMTSTCVCASRGQPKSPPPIFSHPPLPRIFKKIMEFLRSMIMVIVHQKLPNEWELTILFKVGPFS